jgi:hypothetical protein
MPKQKTAVAYKTAFLSKHARTGHERKSRFRRKAVDGHSHHAPYAGTTQIR